MRIDVDDKFVKNDDLVVRGGKICGCVVHYVTVTRFRRNFVRMLVTSHQEKSPNYEVKKCTIKKLFNDEHEKSSKMTTWSSLLTKIRKRNLSIDNFSTPQNEITETDFTIFDKTTFSDKCEAISSYITFCF